VKRALRRCCERPGNRQITRPYFQAEAGHLPPGFEKHRFNESTCPRIDIRAGSVIKKATLGTALHETLGNESRVRLSRPEFVADLSKAQAPAGFRDARRMALGSCQSPVAGRFCTFEQVLALVRYLALQPVVREALRS
jgi:hypothetical protein